MSAGPGPWMAFMLVVLAVWAIFLCHAQPTEEEAKASLWIVGVIGVVSLVVALALPGMMK